VLSERTAAAAGSGRQHWPDPLVVGSRKWGLLLERWVQVKDGVGQVVRLQRRSGHWQIAPGAGPEGTRGPEPQVRLTPCQCSPYYRNSALYPLIDLLERVALRFDREDSPQQKRSKPRGLPGAVWSTTAEAVPLFTLVPPLQLAAEYAPLTMSRAAEARRPCMPSLTILLAHRRAAALLFIMETCTGSESTTLELLSLLVDQGPTRAHPGAVDLSARLQPALDGTLALTQVTLRRLPRRRPPR